MSDWAPAPGFPRAGTGGASWCCAERPTSGARARARLLDGRQYHLISGARFGIVPRSMGKKPPGYLEIMRPPEIGYATSAIVPPPSTWARSSGRQLLAESLENGQFERIESRGFQAQFLGFPKLPSGPVTSAPGLIGPGQVEREAGFPGVVVRRGQGRSGPGRTGRPGSGRRPGCRAGGDRSLDLDGMVDQLQRFLGLALVPQGQQPGQVVERVDVVGIARQHPAVTPRPRRTGLGRSNARQAG